MEPGELSSEFSPRPLQSRVSPGGAALPAQLRPSNPLLVRDEVGKAKATCYDLPPGNGAFGHVGLRDPEGAREVTMQWVSHSPRPRRDERVPDFRQFNKQALKSRMCTAKDQGRLIRETPNMPELSPRSARSNRGPPDRQVEPDACYGRKVRPSTPIDQVLAHKWAAAGEEELQEFYTAALYLKSCPVPARKIHGTLASRGHASASRARSANAPENESKKELFKLTKFKNVPPRLNTFRGQAPSSWQSPRIPAESADAPSANVPPAEVATPSLMAAVA